MALLTNHSRHILPFAALFAFLAAMGQEVVTYDGHVPRHGDRVTTIEVDGLVTESSVADQMVWESDSLAIDTISRTTTYSENVLDFYQGIVPPSPTSSSFRNYEGTQPSLATGAAKVSIPLYTLSYRGVEIPFSLSYLSNGIKVYDDPYPCGYGWSLLPGLRITRTILNRPDELFPFKVAYQGGYDGEYDLSLHSVVTDYSAHDSIDSNLGTLCDSEHDIFTLHLPQKMVTFMLLRDGNNWHAVSNEMDDIRIEVSMVATNGSFLAFTVTDSDGTRYRYGGYGMTESARNDPRKVTAWALADVELTNGEHITFTWTKHSHNDAIKTVMGPARLRDEYQIKGNAEISPDDLDYRPGDDGTYINHYGEVAMLHLHSLSWPTGNITISYAELGSPYVTSFVVRDKDGNHVKDVAFTYGADTNTSLLEHKLLKAVQLSDDGTYSFEYDSHRFDTNHYAQDYWGYYNGRTNNTSGIPAMRVLSRENESSPPFYFPVGTDDRSVDTTMMKANMLTAVHYPTGGWTTFDYEPHLTPTLQHRLRGNIHPDDDPELNVGGGLRVRRIVDHDFVTGDSLVRRYRYGVNECDTARCVAKPFASTFVTVSQSFIQNAIHSHQPVMHRLLYFNPQSCYMSLHYGETPIWYDEVAEYCGEGKTVYSFDDKCPVNQVNEYSFGKWAITGLNHAFSRGIVPTGIKVYKENNSYAHAPMVCVSETRKTYATTPCSGSYISGRHVVRKIVDGSGGVFAPDVVFGLVDILIYTGGAIEPNTFGGISVSFTPDDVYDYFHYTVNDFVERLTSETAIEYLSGGDMTTITNYHHLQHSHLVDSVSQTMSDGGVMTTRNYYPCHIPQWITGSERAVLEQMRDSGMVSTPILSLVTRGGSTLGQGRRFARQSGRLFVPYYDYMQRGSDTTVLRRYWHDALGNVTGISHRNDYGESFLWSEDGQRLLHHVAGLNRDELVAAAGQGLINEVTHDESTGRAKLLGDADVKNGSHVTSYTQRLLVGITSITAPNGVTRRFSYDTQNRLSTVSIDGYGQLTRYDYRLACDDPTAPHNLITTHTAKNATGVMVRDHVDVFDGLGRPLEAIDVGITPSCRNLVSLTQYDAMGRVSRQWLPVPMNSSGVRTLRDYGASTVPPDSVVAASPVAYGGDNHAYAFTAYEPSPRKFTVSLTGAGDDWHNHSKRVITAHRTNTITSGYNYNLCYHYTIDAAGTIHNEGAYSAAQLLIESVTDEDNHACMTFTDKQGNLVLERRLLNARVWADTYYIRDDYADLRCVLSPEASRQMTTEGGSWSRESDLIKQWAYCYRYDNQGRREYERRPGQDSIVTRYDAGGKAVLRQDGNQRASGKWLLTLSDKYRRVVVTALAPEAWVMANATTIATTPLRANFVGVGGLQGYTAGVPLPATIKPLRVVYYDNYNYFNSPTLHVPSTYHYSQRAGYGERYSDATGWDTGEFVWTLGEKSNARHAVTEADSLLCSVFRDRLGRVVQQRGGNHLGGIDVREWLYDYEGHPLKRYRTHTNAHVAVTSEYGYTYDAAGRPLVTTMRYNTDTATLMLNNYNELCRLSQRTMLSSLNTVNYSYNVRGWLTCINGSTGTAFYQQLHYGNASTPCYNGNIGEATWGSTSATIGRYTFTYDKLDRLTAAKFAGDASGLHGTSYGYDLNGNVTTLMRRGLRSKVGAPPQYSYGVIDSVTFVRRGNQLQSARDTVSSPLPAAVMHFRDGANEQTEYTWDANGNMTSDSNRGIVSVTYNVLNLPSRITYADGHYTSFLYAADGRKLQTTHRSHAYVNVINTGIDELRDYSGEYVYRNDTLQRVMTDVGYLDVIAGKHYCFFTDYQGNVRAVRDADGTLLEYNAYYPYGALMTGWGATYTPGFTSLTGEHQPLKYTGKELERYEGVDDYDFGARWYNSTSLTTPTADPLAAETPQLSPYAWCAGNPLRNIDPSGRKAIVTIDDDRIIISVNVILYDSNNHENHEELKELSKSFEKSLYDTWGSYTEFNTASHKYKISWNIHVRPLGANEKIDYSKPTNNYLNIKSSGRSYVRGTVDGEIRTDISAHGNPLPHEFGHILGLRDRYEHDTNLPYAGWEGNVMAEPAGEGLVEVRNIDSLLKPFVGLYETYAKYSNGYLINLQKTFYINKRNREAKIR